MEKIGRYRITGELGTGGFGTVYQATDPDMGRVVAIKVLKAQDDAGMVKRFQAEARMAANLRRHPNIVTVFDFGEENGRLYLVMEYLDGTTLADLILNKTPLSTLEKLHILAEAALGLKAAHESGIVHRDVKPANIMRLRDGSVKIMDFGISRAMENVDTRLTQTGFMMGTPAYMAPEQFTGSDADILCDIWAYGVVLYEFLTGTNPFHAPTAPQVIYRATMEEPLPLAHYLPGVPESLEGLVKRLLSKNRGLRYQTLEEVCFDLDAVLLELRQPQIQGMIADAENLIRERRLDEAQAMVRRVQDMDRSNAWARQRRGELQQMARAQQLLDQASAATLAGDEAAAAGHLEAAKKLDPSNAAVRKRLDEIQANRARAERAIRERLEDTTRLDAARIAQQRIEPPTRATKAPSETPGLRPEADGSASRWLWIGGIVALLALAVFVYVMVRPSERALSVQPAELSFAYRQAGLLPNAGVVEVKAKPADNVWTVAASDPWITVSPAQLRGDGLVQVTVNAASLAPGDHSGFATVSAKDASANVRIHLSVTPEPAAPKTEPKAAPAEIPNRSRVNPADGLTYVFIPPGRFTMGCSPGDSECFENEKPPHAGQIANGFWLGQTEVTQAAWQKVMKGDNPSNFKGDQLPVERVDWNQASAYCKAIGGRLPTEKEWEYAARAGTSVARYGALDAVAWYTSNSGSTTHPVGLKQANAFGLYDMLGNVWEWTADDYAAGQKLVRGGSWDDFTRLVRASGRIRVGPTKRYDNIGFRCVGEFR